MKFASIASAVEVSLWMSLRLSPSVVTAALPRNPVHCDRCDTSAPELPRLLAAGSKGKVLTGLFPGEVNTEALAVVGAVELESGDSSGRAPLLRDLRGGLLGLPLALVAALDTKLGLEMKLLLPVLVL